MLQGAQQFLGARHDVVLAYKRHGLKLTQQRLFVLDALFDSAAIKVSHCDALLFHKGLELREQIVQ